MKEPIVLTFELSRTTKFEEFEFETKAEAMAYRNSYKRGVFDVYEKEK